MKSKVKINKINQIHKIKVNKEDLWKVFLLILLCILFALFFLKYVIVKRDYENYLNYFLPYYSNNSIAAYDFYKRNEDNNNQTKKSFLYQPIRIGFDEDGDFIKQLGSMFVAKSFIQNVEYVKDSNEMTLLRDCNNHNLDIVNCANPLISNSYANPSYDYKNLRFICNTNKMYLYILSTRASRIESLSDILQVANRDFKVSVDYEGSVAHLFCKDIFESLGYQEDRDYTILYGKDGSSKTALERLTKNESKMCILSLPFHPKLLKDVCCGLGTELFFLPFELYNQEKTRVFFTKNYYYIPDFYDLNDICETYLPKKYGGKTYTRFTAQIPIVSYYNTLVCNDRFDDDRTKEILRTFYENIALFNQLPVFHKQPIYKTQLNAGPQNALPLNNGAKEFFMEHGYITMEENQSCKYLVGVEQCNKASLEKHGFEEHGKVLDSIFRFH